MTIPWVCRRLPQTIITYFSPHGRAEEGVDYVNTVMTLYIRRACFIIKGTVDSGKYMTLLWYSSPPPTPSSLR